MKEFIRYIKSILGIYETGYEYWIRLDKIKIPDDYKRTRIGQKKWRRKMAYWLRAGEFESKIIINKNFDLIDGYSSVKIAQLNGIDKVPAYFAD